MSFPAVSGRRRRSRDWLQMDDTIPTSDWLPVTMPVLVNGEIYLVNAELPIIPDDDRRRLDAIWRKDGNGPQIPDIRWVFNPLENEDVIISLSVDI